LRNKNDPYFAGCSLSSKPFSTFRSQLKFFCNIAAMVPSVLSAGFAAAAVVDLAFGAGKVCSSASGADGALVLTSSYPC